MAQPRKGQRERASGAVIGTGKNLVNRPLLEPSFGRDLIQRAQPRRNDPVGCGERRLAFERGKDSTVLTGDQLHDLQVSSDIVRVSI